MENVAGEDLGWFWRRWIQNNWKLDQAISGVKYVDNNYTKGAVITIQNLEKMPMPVDLRIQFKDGSHQDMSLPVEIWRRNTEWTFKVPTTKEIQTVIIDPDGNFPDINPSNNVWKG